MNIFSVLFDLDGTLLDTIPDLASACNAMRLDLGLPVLPEERIATFVGKGSENLVRRALTDLPVACGFGIATADQVRAVVKHADAAIVGSALVKRMADPRTAVADAARFVAELTTGLA